MPSFYRLWRNHPANWNPPEYFPCKDQRGRVHAALANQCAIRMGLALQGAGVKTNSVAGGRCWNNHGRDHILRVLDLVPWIERNVASIGCQPKVVHKNVTFRDFAGQKGIMYFQNFYGRGNQGDHLDLWNGFMIAKGDLDYFERSEEVWFWKM
jgi:hypothetical protein